jgi:hypothetical protein
MGYSVAPKTIFTMNHKVYHWNGQNKQIVRRDKIDKCEAAQGAGFLPPTLHALTLAGAQAHFERGLVQKGITTPHHITTVQTVQPKNGHDTRAIMQSLRAVRDEHLPGMLIWPHSLESLSKGWGRKRFKLPPRRKNATWYKDRDTRAEMMRFGDKEPQPNHIFDDDRCGIFSEENATTVIRLMLSGALAERGLFFTNFLKGRDNPSGRNTVFNFLKRYYSKCKHFDVKILKDLDLNANTESTWRYVRRVLAPIHYICEAFDAGYRLDIEYLQEYRDRNKETGCGNVMMQWCFRFERLDSHALQEKDRFFAMSRAYGRERKRLGHCLRSIAREEYTVLDPLGC